MCPIAFCTASLLRFQVPARISASHQKTTPLVYVLCRGTRAPPGAAVLCPFSVLVPLFAVHTTLFPEASAETTTSGHVCRSAQMRQKYYTHKRRDMSAGCAQKPSIPERERPQRRTLRYLLPVRRRWSLAASGRTEASGQIVRVTD